MSPEEPRSGSIADRLHVWLPLSLVVGGFSLSWLPSQDALLSALLVGAYLIYAAAITALHFLPWLSNQLS